MKEMRLFGNSTNLSNETNRVLESTEEIINSSNVSNIISKSRRNMELSTLFEIIQHSYFNAFEKETSILGRILMCFDFALFNRLNKYIVGKNSVNVDAAISKLVTNYLSWDPTRELFQSVYYSNPRTSSAKIRFTKLELPKKETHRVLRQSIFNDIICCFSFDKYDKYCQFKEHSSLPTCIVKPDILDLDLSVGKLNHYVWLYHGLLQNLPQLEHLLMLNGSYNCSLLIEINKHLLNSPIFVFEDQDSWKEFIGFYNEIKNAK